MRREERRGEAWGSGERATEGDSEDGEGAEAWAGGEDEGFSSTISGTQDSYSLIPGASWSKTNLATSVCDHKERHRQ
ncbi:hypothetical protein PAMP_014475 [Pampus punctatissimus]